MKTFTTSLIFIIFFASSSVNAQQQINNSGFENWDNLGVATEEPADWNSFKSGYGPLILYASQQIKHSTQIRPGSTGNYSCVIWSKSILSIVANGNVTTGQIHMGSSTATDTSNYNISHTAQPAFSEALGNTPDSLVAWVRFKPANAGGSDSARIRASIHDTYEFRDPADAQSLTHLVGSAIKNFRSAYNQWERISIPFKYNGTATSPDYILVSMTTNKTPGGGSGGDSLYIDDLSLVYNDISVPEINHSSNLSVLVNENDITISLSFEKPAVPVIDIYNMNGQLVYSNKVSAGSTQEKISTNKFNKGIYLVSITAENGQRLAQKIALR